MQTLIFTLVSSTVERMGDLVQPHAQTILSWLPSVWQHSEGQGLLRMQARSFPAVHNLISLYDRSAVLWA